MSLAPIYMRDLQQYGAKREQLGARAVASRNGANLNYHDVSLTLDDYVAARMIPGRVGLFGCDIPFAGAGALVLATADRAQDLAKKTTGRRLWESTGLTPRDIGAAMTPPDASLQSLGMTKVGTQPVRA
jgi:acetyl-CoA acetyltransferase